MYLLDPLRFNPDERYPPRPSMPTRASRQGEEGDLGGIGPGAYRRNDLPDQGLRLAMTFFGRRQPARCHPPLPAGAGCLVPSACIDFS